ncbi:MAG: hypothetical protein PVG82_00040 [Chromatiales bacterium]|jgi:hypothetical protein
MKLGHLLIILTLAASGVALAQEHPACSDLDYRYETHSSKGLRTIAASCGIPAIANLYYNRAYHADLVAEGTTLAGLIAHSPNRSGARFESYRLYMAMVEQLAPTWYPDTSERVRFLNREYDRRGEIARLRLRGYDHLADRLEREAVTR